MRDCLEAAKREIILERSEKSERRNKPEFVNTPKINIKSEKNRVYRKREELQNWFPSLSNETSRLDKQDKIVVMHLGDPLNLFRLLKQPPRIRGQSQLSKLLRVADKVKITLNVSPMSQFRDRWNSFAFLKPTWKFSVLYYIPPSTRYQSIVLDFDSSWTTWEFICEPLISVSDDARL